MFEGQRHGSINQSNITPTLRDSRDNAYIDSKEKKRSKNLSSAKKMRTSSFNRSLLTQGNNFTYVKKTKQKVATNDFDPKTVKDGLDQIDLEIQDIDQNLPEEEYEHDEDETAELIRSNKILRDKVSQIADLVVSAINKAAILRKQISTHRDKPDDPVLNSKLKEINRYQKAIMKMKYPKVHHNPKIQEMQDESEIILAEISKLEDERSTLKKQNLNRKKAYKEVMTNNQDQYARLDTLKESLREEKEGVSNCS